LGWRDILHVQVKGWGVDVHVGSILIGAVLTLILIIATASRRRRPGWRVTKANFTFAGFGQVEICPTNDVARIAHNAWVELHSRKAAIPFDPEHDVIVEIYNSWYALFGILRTLAKEIPVDSVRAANGAPVLTEVLLGSLNDGLRPHLTRWQARFRRWYDSAIRDGQHDSLSPQEVQRLFPQYDALMEDLLTVNAGMVQFSEELRKIAHDRRRELSPWRRRNRGQS
jgi:hypothetical protein